MKKSSLFLLLMVLVMLLSACSNQAKKITLTELKSALESYDVDIKTIDDGKNITQFTITASNINADWLWCSDVCHWLD